MSDKELDQLFQSRFEDFEIEPSASLWSSIEGQLGEKPRKRAMPVFWMAAASVVVLLGAGLWMMKPEQKVYLHGKQRLAVHKKVETGPVQFEEQTGEEEVARTAAAPVSRKMSRPFKVAGPKDVRSQEIVPLQPKDEVMLATVQEEPSRAEQGFSAAVSEVAEPHVRKGEVHQTVLAMLPDEGTGSLDESTPHQRRKIKSVGDIVNFVVAKVDQREDKLIEMSEDDEGTKISAINLGLFKIKSKKR